MSRLSHIPDIYQHPKEEPIEGFNMQQGGVEVMGCGKYG